MTPSTFTRNTPGRFQPPQRVHVIHSTRVPEGTGCSPFFQFARRVVAGKTGSFCPTKAAVRLVKRVVVPSFVQVREPQVAPARSPL